MSIRKGTTIISGNPASPSWGSIEGVLDDQLDLKNSLGSKAPLNSPVLTGTPQAPTASAGTNNKQIATTQFVTTAIQNISALPSQSGQSGKFLTTNGTTASWGSITGLPSQSGNNGKILTTNGTTASWISYSPTPDTDNSTISLNSSSKLQAIGLIDKKSGNAIYDWVGTYAQWQSGRNGGTIPDTWICYITDDYDSLTDDIVSIEQDITSINNELSNKLDSRYISNCVLEEPKNIKLELNNGTLTIKSGSKLYYPDGLDTNNNKKFGSISLSSDNSLNLSSSGLGADIDNLFIFYNKNGAGWQYRPMSNVESGNSEPATGSGITYYNTDNNTLISHNSQSGVDYDVTFPLCSVKYVDGTGITQINQVFDGVGFVGNTLFRNSLIKGLIPNGRKTDGTLQNIGFVPTSSVATREFNNPPDGINYICLTTTTFGFNQSYRYDQTKNIQYGNDDIAFTNGLHIGEITVQNNKIVALKVKNVFQASDYFGTGFPSNRSENLVLGVSGTEYIAPGDGWVQITMLAQTSSGSYITITSGDMAIGDVMPINTEMDINLCFPISKGSIFKVYYGSMHPFGEGQWDRFKFIYANNSR